MTRIAGAKDVGRVTIDFEVANYGDVIQAMQGTLDPDKVRRVTLKGIVDEESAAAASALLAPAARSRLGAPDRQHAMSLDRDFRSSPTHGAARQRTGKDTDGPSIQAALN